MASNSLCFQNRFPFINHEIIIEFIEPTKEQITQNP